MQYNGDPMDVKKRFLLITLIVSVLYLCSLILLSVFLDAGSFKLYLLTFLAVCIVQLVLPFLSKRWFQPVLYISFISQLVVIFYTIIRLGGISNSAGMLMFAYFLLFTCLWIEDIRLLLISAGIYIAGVLLSGILFSYIRPAIYLSDTNNNIFFAVNFGVIGLFTALALYKTILKGEEVAARKTHEIEEINNLKTRLFDNLTHEFRTPLTIIKGYAGEMSALPDEGLRYSANSIISNSDDLLIMINRMLDLSAEDIKTGSLAAAGDSEDTLNQPELPEFTSVDSETSGRKKILVMEDNKELLDYLVHLLENEYLVIRSTDGVHGLECAFRFIPDIVISDVMMPGKDGFEVCRELKNDFRTDHIPVVLLTAMAGRDSRILGYEHGADAYLTKPFDKKDLKICLSSLLIQREKLKLKYLSGLYDLKSLNLSENVNEQFLENVKKVVEENYHNPSFSSEDLCKETGIGRTQLNRKLAALTGLTSSVYIRNFRLHKGLNLLKKTTKTVSEIAYETGFTDPNYFTRSFSAEYGMTPKQLRS